VRPVGLLSVGWSHPSAMGIDIPFVKMPKISDGSGWSYYIPASSFKGALRSSASKIAHAYGFTSCGEIKPDLLESENQACDVCYLFGTINRRKPRIYFSDLLPSKISEPSVMLLTHTRIDDRSQTVAEHGLYTIEAILPTIEFTGSIMYLDLAGKLPLLLLALAGLRLGRFGRRSLIDIRLEGVDRLRNEVEPKWTTLVNELGEWLWSA